MAGRKPDMILPQPTMMTDQPAMLRLHQRATAGWLNMDAELDRRDDLNIQLPRTLLLAATGLDRVRTKPPCSICSASVISPRVFC